MWRELKNLIEVDDAADGGLSLLHGLEHGRLGLGAGAVDLVEQDDVGVHGPELGGELTGGVVEDIYSPIHIALQLCLYLPYILYNHICNLSSKWHLVSQPRASVVMGMLEDARLEQQHGYVSSRKGSSSRGGLLERLKAFVIGHF